MGTKSDQTLYLIRELRIWIQTAEVESNMLDGELAQLIRQADEAKERLTATNKAHVEAYEAELNGPGLPEVTRDEADELAYSAAHFNYYEAKIVSTRKRARHLKTLIETFEDDIQRLLFAPHLVDQN